MSDYQLAITIPGPPIAWARAGRDKRSGRSFTKRPQVAHKLAIQRAAIAALKEAGLGKIKTGPVHMLAAFHFTLPPSISGAEATRRLSGAGYHPQKPDVDNLVKLVKDALNGVVFHDDAQIATLSASKYWTFTTPGETRLVITAPQNLTGH